MDFPKIDVATITAVIVLMSAGYLGSALAQIEARLRDILAELEKIREVLRASS